MIEVYPLWSSKYQGSMSSSSRDEGNKEKELSHTDLKNSCLSTGFVRMNSMIGDG